MQEVLSAWANEEPLIRAMVLQGSRGENKADVYSDYDLALFCTNEEFLMRKRLVPNIGIGL